MEEYVDLIRRKLQEEIATLPENFYDTFQYTQTGTNYTHPITLGILSKILWSIEGVKYVGIDFRLNEKWTKFQPDLVALSSIDSLDPKLILDYESPNSSDRRIQKKDVRPYGKWIEIKGGQEPVPYIIITTLPDKESPNWELRWTAEQQVNLEYRDQRNNVRKNPFAFWYDKYREHLPQEVLSNIYFLNINGKEVHDVTDQIKK